MFCVYSVVRDAKINKFVKRYYSTEDIDFYAIYCPALNKCFMVPATQVSKNGSLRLVPSVFSKARGGKLASDFDLESWSSGRTSEC